jgi:hypothetical protein
VPIQDNGCDECAMLRDTYDLAEEYLPGYFADPEALCLACDDYWHKSVTDDEIWTPDE